MAIQQRTGDAKVKGVADVVFLFDCTGSMAPYIENVKDNVASLIKGFNGTPNVKLDWRVRAMGYKDFFVDKDCLITPIHSRTTSLHVWMPMAVAMRKNRH